MLKAIILAVSPLDIQWAALRSRMATQPMRSAMCLGLCAGAINALIAMLLLLAALALFSPQHLGGAASSSLEGAGTARIFWAAVIWAPLFETLMAQGDWGQPIARRIYVRTRGGYHAVTRGSVDRVVGVPGAR